jgi:hypothetical protein
MACSSRGVCRCTIIYVLSNLIVVISDCKAAMRLGTVTAIRQFGASTSVAIPRRSSSNTPNRPSINNSCMFVHWFFSRSLQNKTLFIFIDVGSLSASAAQRSTPPPIDEVELVLSRSSSTSLLDSLLNQTPDDVVVHNPSYRRNSALRSSDGELLLFNESDPLHDAHLAQRRSSGMSESSLGGIDDSSDHNNNNNNGGDDDDDENDDDDDDGDVLYSLSRVALRSTLDFERRQHQLQIEMSMKNEVYIVVSM